MGKLAGTSFRSHCANLTKTLGTLITGEMLMTKRISGRVLCFEDVEVIHDMTQLPGSMSNGATQMIGTMRVFAIMDDSQCRASQRKNDAKCVLVSKGEVSLILSGWVMSGVTLDLR